MTSTSQFFAGCKRGYYIRFSEKEHMFFNFAHVIVFLLPFLSQKFTIPSLKKSIESITF